VYTGLVTTFSAVATTGIYCRPGCGARPLLQNTLTFESAAAAEAAGFRACLRCRPYRVPGPLGNSAPEMVCEAVQRIIDGALDQGTETELARQLGVSARHLRRLFVQHLGATPDQVARSRRAHFARRMLDDTDLPVIDIAFASGFGSLRQFNRTMQEVFRAPPTDLRQRRRRSDRLAADGGLALRLPVRQGYDWDGVLSFLAAKSIPGIESVEDDTYRRTIKVASAPGVVEVSPGTATSADPNLLLRVHLPYWEGLIHVVEHVARVLGADCDHTVGSVASVDRPPPDGSAGSLVPGGWSTLEVGVWSILSATPDGHNLLRKLVVGLGDSVPGLPGGLSHTFPDAASLTDGTLETRGIPASEAAAIASLARSIADCPSTRLDPKLWRPWRDLGLACLGGSRSVLTA